MEFEHTLEILHNQAMEISKTTQEFKSANGIRKIEIDLLLEKLRDIYDLVSELQTVTEDVPAENNQVEALPDDSDHLVEQEEIKEPEFEVELAKEDDDIAEKPIAEVKENEEDAFVSDRFKTEDKTVNEEISDTADKEDITLQYKTSAISSITSAIGLNEKFELINELFEGDKAKFEKTIDVLNAADSFVEAFNYLEENFNWDMDNVYVQRILELIRRKLIVRRDEQ